MILLLVTDLNIVLDDVGIEPGLFSLLAEETLIVPGDDPGCTSKPKGDILDTDTALFALLPPLLEDTGDVGDVTSFLLDSLPVRLILLGVILLAPPTIRSTNLSVGIK